MGSEHSTVREQKSSGRQPTVQQPTAKQPTVQQPTVQKSTVQKPTVQLRTGNSPYTDEIEPSRNPSPPMQKEDYNLETLIAASQPQSDDFSPKERQYLQEKLEGINVELQPSHEVQRFNAIKNFYRCLLESLEIPTNSRPFGRLYHEYRSVFFRPQYEDVFRKGTEELPEGIFDAYIRLDFWRVRRDLSQNGKYRGAEVFLNEMQDSFMKRSIPQLWYSPGHHKNTYEGNTLKMVKFFRNVYYNALHVCPRGEKRIVTAIQTFLDDYQYDPQLEGQARLKMWHTNTYELYKDSVKTIYGEMSPKMYQSFLRIDLFNLEKRLRAMGATEIELELANIVGQCLIDGQLSLSSQNWLARNVSNIPAPAEHKRELAGSESSQSKQSNLIGNQTTSQAPASVIPSKPLAERSEETLPAYTYETEADSGRFALGYGPNGWTRLNTLSG